MLATTLGGFKEDATLTPSGNQGQPSLPEGVEGTATITYELTYNDENCQSVVNVAVPIELKIDPDNENFMNVKGDKYSIYYIQVKGSGDQSRIFFIHWDYPIQFFFIGTSKRMIKMGRKAVLLRTSSLPFSI